MYLAFLLLYYLKSKEFRLGKEHLVKITKYAGIYPSESINF